MSYTMKQKYWWPSEEIRERLNVEGKMLLFLILKQLCQVQHRAEHPFPCFQSQLGLHSLEKHAVRRGETEKLSWQPWRKFTFLLFFLLMTAGNVSKSRLPRTADGSVLLVRLLLAQRYFGIYLPSSGRAGTKAAREEKATLRAPHLPGNGGKSSFLSCFQAGILGFVARSQFSVAEPTSPSCRITKIALKV